MTKLRAVALTGALAIVTACGASTAPESRRAPARSGPVIIVSIDTLRADRLPVYGYSRIETPAIDRLATDGVVWETAFAHAPTTLASHASIFTGQTPAQHGVRDNVGYELPAAATTLAERFQDAGRRTAGFVSSYPMRAGTGLDQGFDVWDDEMDPSAEGAGIGEIQRDGIRTVARAADWLRDQGDGDFFLFLHLFEPHLPYAAPAAFAAKYDSPYDAEVAYADHLVGKFLAAVDATGFYEDATIILLADHGEGLGDHDEDDHGIFVYPSTLRVPLLAKLPGKARAGERSSTVAQLADVASTLLSLTAGEPLADTVGRDLLGAVVADADIYAETYQPPLHFGWSELLTLIDYPHQYIQAPEPELYDLRADPRATMNLIADRPDVAGDMRDRLAALEVELELPREVDASTRDRLAALGYVTSVSVSPDGDLPDPKHRIHLLRHLKVASATFFAGDYDVAIEEFETAIEEDPTMPAAWEWLGRAQQAAGRVADALDSFEMLTSLGAGDQQTDLAIAQLALATGRFDVAAKAANRLLTTHPVQARITLAHVALAEGRLEDAGRLAARTFEDAPDNGAAHLLLGEVLAQQGDLSGALRHGQAAAADAATEPSALVFGGRVLMIAGEVAGARANFLLAIEKDASLLQAYVYLAASHFAQREVDSGLAALTAMVQRNPGPEAEKRALDTLSSFGLGELIERWRAGAGL